MDIAGGVGRLASEVAKQGGVNLETVRYYERRGLLPKPPRTATGYRAFEPDAVRRLRFIRHAQALGFSLHEIKELLALRVKAGVSSADVRQRAQAKLVDIDEKLKTLRAMKKVLTRFTESCSGAGPISRCPILAALEREEGQ
ncbi:MAG: MerR family transcriptional regulator [Deltaproteobacteria bacterium]|nr:MAG: MerR family transcriptional regulator [Deltaproteobacteria bacterium]